MAKLTWTEPFHGVTHATVPLSEGGEMVCTLTVWERFTEARIYCTGRSCGSITLWRTTFHLKGHEATAKRWAARKMSV